MFDTGEFTAAPSSPHADAADTPLAEHPPGAGLAAALAGVDLSETSDYALVEVLRAVRRMTSWAQAIEQAATAELAGRPGQDPEFAADEIAAALTMTLASANRQVSLAWELGHRLPATLAALSGGEIDLPKARTIGDATSTLDPAAAHDVELAALERASDQTTGQLRARTARLAARVDPHAAARRHERARRQRRVALEPGPDGTATCAACRCRPMTRRPLTPTSTRAPARPAMRMTRARWTNSAPTPTSACCSAVTLR